MKSWIGYIVAGIIGALLVIGVQYHFLAKQDKAHAMEAIDTPSWKPHFAREADPPAVTFDFVRAAEIATPAVVYIKVEESEKLARRRYESYLDQWDPFRGTPFEGFFKDKIYDPFHRDFLPRRKGEGSGIIISPDGYIVTNNHVVEFGDRFEVTLNDGRTYSARLIGREPRADLAVLKIDAEDLPYLEYGDSDEVKVGQWVLAIGNPFGYLRSTVTAGIISAKGRDLNIIPVEGAVEEFLQTDAVINPGNSGGALVNTEGKLIGVCTAIATRTGVFNGYSFAIPSNLMRTIVDDIIQHGSYQRPLFGVYVVPIDDELQEALGLETKEGVVIDELVQGGAAQLAGLLPNDVIVKIDKRPIRTVQDLRNALANYRVGDTITVTIIRNGKEKQLQVRLQQGI